MEMSYYKLPPMNEIISFWRINMLVRKGVGSFFSLISQANNTILLCQQ